MEKKSRFQVRRIIQHVAVLLLSASLVGATLSILPGESSSDPALAVTQAGFDPGYLISDAEFYDGFTMSAEQVQAFLDARVPVCTGPNGCLKNYSQATPNIAADNYCGGYSARNSETASSIIVNVARSCGMNPKAILTLLEKEQSLVSSRAPSSWAFRAATGMGCPDTAPCDPRISGFFYQVFYAARQFQIYKRFPTSFNHRPGQVNNVLYHPNSACGRKSVFIQNSATAGLYNYTPYTPNAAALANMYGVGDSCSSYGNRNFWRIYSDWFGSPTSGGALLTSTNTGRSFFVTGTDRWEVPDARVRATLDVFGPAKPASSQVLNSFTDRGVMRTAVLRNKDNQIGVISGNSFRAFLDCDAVADFGSSCSDPLPKLSQYHSSLLSTGTSVGSTVQTSWGQKFVMDGGVRREVLDDASLHGSPWVGPFVSLDPRVLVSVPLGAPLLRDGAFFATSSGRTLLYANGTAHLVGPYTAPQIGAVKRASGTLAEASASQLPQSAIRFDGVVEVDDRIYVLTEGGSWEWVASPSLLAQAPVRVPRAFLDGYTSLGVVAEGDYIRALDGVAPYRIESNIARSAPDMVNAETAAIPTILMVNMTKGPPQYPSGSLMRTADAPSVFLVNGQSRVRLLDMAIPSAQGFGPVRWVSQASLEAYDLATAPLSWILQCGGTKYVGVDGVLRPIPEGLMPHYSLATTPIVDELCNVAVTGPPMTEFVRINQRSIFKVENGQVRQVMSLSRWFEVKGESTFVDVAPGFVSAFPRGPEL